MQTTINNLATQKANRYNTLAADYLANKKALEAARAAQEGNENE